MTILWVDTLSVISDIWMFATVPIYILILSLLVKHRKDRDLNHSFFALIFSVGIADIGKTLQMFFGNKLAGYGWVAEIYWAIGPLASRLNAIFSFLFGAAQSIGVLLIACNRFTAYIFPFRHQQIWRGGKLLYIFILLKWLISIASITPMIFYFQYKFNFNSADNRSIILAWMVPTDANNINYYFNLAGRGSLLTMSIILYIIIFAAAVIRKIERNQLTIVEKAALNMSIVGFLHCIGIIVSLISIIILVLGLVGCDWVGQSVYCVDNSVFYLISNIGNSLCASVTPYALLMFSTPVRIHFFHFCQSNCLLKFLSWRCTKEEPLTSAVNLIPDTEQNVNVGRYSETRI